MVITIVGTGNMARGIATRALAGGHSVTLLGTESAKAQALADELSGDVSAGEVGDPLTGDVVVLAVWYAAVDDVLGRYGDQLDGKVVVDVTNPIDVDAWRHATDRRRATQARPRDRGAGLPAHGHSTAARHRLLYHGQGSLLAAERRRPQTDRPRRRRRLD
jgi:3-hydroxyisobutyrate dehydrogenase-like beta-hydroxyacid dehydrogenase